jgi:PqqD family protein of HPr-rel-A system
MGRAALLALPRFKCQAADPKIMSEPRFAAPARESLIAVPLDGLTAIYHRNAAQTHVVMEPVPEILEALAAEALAADALLAKLGVDLNDDNRAALAARLDELEESGLIARR